VGTGFQASPDEADRQAFDIQRPSKWIIMSDTQTPQQLFSRARQCLKKGDHHQAIRLLSVLDSQGHDSPGVLETLAVSTRARSKRLNGVCGKSRTEFRHS
jgi:hypothetical protein